MVEKFPGGVWPVMLTPFTSDNQIDYDALGELVDWYIAHGVDGLFAVCQSSEMFCLSLEERIDVAKFVKEKAAGRVPVIASGHVSDSFEDQVQEIKKIAATGIDAFILITNRLASAEESDEIWLENLTKLLEAIPTDIKLGFYECPYPYKRVMTKKMTEYCASTGRFYFLKDTSCDIHNIKEKLSVIKGSQFKLYNANTATLLESLEAGAAGYSGVMANFHPELYDVLCREYKKPGMTDLSDSLTICALIERQVYPVNAKYYLQLEGLSMNLKTRVKEAAELNETFQKEVKMLRSITLDLNKKYESYIERGNV